MKFYGADIAEGGAVTNLTAPSGTAFPDNANVGEFFFRTDESKLYCCTGEGSPPTWTDATAGGASGGDGYVHEQTSASTTWTISHNLNEEVPAVTVWVDYGSPSILQQALPSTIEATDADTITLTFSAAQTGKAIVVSRASATTLGKHTMWIPVKMMHPHNTNGALLSDVDSSAQDYPVYRFDASTNEYVTCQLYFPKSYDGNAFQVSAVWYTPSSNGDVVWSFNSRFNSDGSSPGDAYGSAATVTDTVVGNTIRYTTFTSVTASGSAAGNKWANLLVGRSASSGSDTLAADAYLIGVAVTYTTNAATDD